jgi:hypothetical protein
MHKKIIIILIFIAVAGIVGFLITHNREDAQFLTTENEGITLAQIEQEINMAVQNGGIHPDNYERLDQALQLFESQGTDPGKTAELRNKLEKLDVGGRNIKAPAPEPTKTVQRQTSSPKISVSPTTNPTPKPTIIQQPTCTSNTKPVFSKYLVDPSHVTNILPPPNRPRTDLTVLKTHSYVGTTTSTVPVYAPVDMEFFKGAHYVGGPYTLDFRVSCEVTLRLAHVTNIVQKLKDVLPSEPATGSQDQPITNTVAFKAGELIGYSGGPPYVLGIGFDFGVYNNSTPNRFAAEPDKYTSSTYTTAVCPFDYFTADMRGEYKKKYYLQAHEGMQYDLPHFCQ